MTAELLVPTSEWRWGALGLYMWFDSCGIGWPELMVLDALLAADPVLGISRDAGK
jgi:hypothetical protein